MTNEAPQEQVREEGSATAQALGSEQLPLGLESAQEQVDGPAQQDSLPGEQGDAFEGQEAGFSEEPADAAEEPAAESAAEPGAESAVEEAAESPENESAESPEENLEPERSNGRPVERVATVTAPEQTRDDTDAGWGERRDDSAHDRWLQEQRPPHWE